MGRELDIDDVAAGNPRAERDLVNLRQKCHRLERELGTARRDYEVMNRIREGVEAERDELLHALEVAMEFIHESPCDPDIKSSQADAHMRLMDVKPMEIIARIRGEEQE